MSVGAGPTTSTGASAAISRPRSTTSESNSGVRGHPGARIVTEVAQMRDFPGTDCGLTHAFGWTLRRRLRDRLKPVA